LPHYLYALVTCHVFGDSSAKRGCSFLVCSGVIHGQHLGLWIMEDMEIESLRLLQHVISDLLPLKAAWSKPLLVNISSMLIVEGDPSGNDMKMRMIHGHPSLLTIVTGDHVIDLVKLLLGAIWIFLYTLPLFLLGCKGGLVKSFVP
jgi:hypothetical protein